MADDAATSTEDSQITFNVKAANDQKHVFTLPASTTIGDLKAKLSSSEYADLPAERQRLIYSGRVLKDHDTLASSKLKDGNTIHLVKGAASNARQNPASQGTGSPASAPASQVPTNIASGTGNNPLAGLTGARYAGFHGLPSMDTFGADGGMGGPPNPDQLLSMMENPNFLQQMNEAMENPTVIEMMQNSPMVRNNPMIQNMLRDPETRRAMFNPEMMRMQLQMQRAMNQGGGSSFPMPGATNTTPQNSAGTQNQPSNNPTPNPLGALTGGGTAGSTQPTQDAQNASTASPPPANPFASLFGAAGSGTGGQANPMAESFQQMMQNPDMMRRAMEMMNPAMASQGGNDNPFAAFGQPPANPFDATGTSNSAPANPFHSLFGPGGGFSAPPPPPQDNRPPEEIYEVQLRQLNEMGFYEFDRNVAALRRSGGNVQGAIESLLGGTS